MRRGRSEPASGLSRRWQFFIFVVLAVGAVALFVT